MGRRRERPRKPLTIVAASHKTHVTRNGIASIASSRMKRARAVRTRSTSPADTSGPALSSAEWSSKPMAEGMSPASSLDAARSRSPPPPAARKECAQ